MTLNAVANYLSQYPADSASRNASWLLMQQTQAMAELRTHGFPTRRMEDWRYTDVQPILKQDFRFGASSVTANVDKDAARIDGLDCYRLIFMNGRLVHGDAITGSGIIVKTIRQALASDDRHLSEHLNHVAAHARNAFIDLNTVFIQDGCLITLADKAVLDRPLQLVYLSDRESASQAINPRNVIVLGKQSEATLIESYVGDETAVYFSNTITEVSLGEGARLTHYKLVQEGAAAFHIGNLQVEQARDSRLVSHSITLGGRLVRNDIGVRLAGSGAETILNGLYVANGNHHVDNHTQIDHQVPHTVSSENYRGVLSGRARAVFNGRVIVHPGAQKTDAQQSNANLLLSDDAEVDTKPELQIHADDVKCSHGATIGRLDETMLYYLRTRAIPEDLARSLLTFAFAGDVIGRIELAPVRDWLQKHVVGQLPDADLIREFIR